jgi:hypothetical protein
VWTKVKLVTGAGRTLDDWARAAQFPAVAQAQLPIYQVGIGNADTAIRRSGFIPLIS